MAEVKAKNFINDSIAVPAIKKAVSDLELANQSWIMHGYPRTKF